MLLRHNSLLPPSTTCFLEQGDVLRHSKHIKLAAAQVMALDTRELADVARHVVRDAEPTDDLVMLRLRGRERELLIVPAGKAIVVAVQRWCVAPIGDDA